MYKLVQTYTMNIKMFSDNSFSILYSNLFEVISKFYKTQW